MLDIQPSARTLYLSNIYHLPLPCSSHHNSPLWAASSCATTYAAWLGPEFMGQQIKHMTSESRFVVSNARRVFAAPPCHGASPRPEFCTGRVFCLLQASLATLLLYNSSFPHPNLPSFSPEPIPGSNHRQFIIFRRRRFTTTSDETSRERPKYGYRRESRSAQ